MRSQKKLQLRYDHVSVLVLDESVSIEEKDRALDWVLKRGARTPKVVEVREHYSGLADERILASLLNSTTLMVTRDRPFHNAVLARGYRSLIFHGEVITDRPLPGIRPKEIPLRKPEELEQGILYHPPAVPLRPFLMPTSERELKTLSTRRRRIRNHFGGLQNLNELAVTVSWLKVTQGILVGVRLRVSASNGMKALDASESYLLEKCPTGEAWSAALCHTLMIPIRLLLCSLKTTVYYDAVARSQEVVPSYHPGFQQLKACFPMLTFQSSTRGLRVEQLRRKLQDLALGQSNEVRPSDLPRCLQQFALAAVAIPS